MEPEDLGQEDTKRRDHYRELLFALSVPLVVLDEEFSIDLANRAFRFGHKTRSMPTRYHILALVRLQEVGSKLEAHMKVKEASDAGKCELMALDTALDTM